MRIHKEGYLPIVVTLFIVGLLVGFYTWHALHHGTHVWLTVLVCAVAFLLIFQVVRFFNILFKRQRANVSHEIVHLMTFPFQQCRYGQFVDIRHRVNHRGTAGGPVCRFLPLRSRWDDKGDIHFLRD